MCARRPLLDSQARRSRRRTYPGFGGNPSRGRVRMTLGAVRAAVRIPHENPTAAEVLQAPFAGDPSFTMPTLLRNSRCDK